MPSSHADRTIPPASGLGSVIHSLFAFAAGETKHTVPFSSFHLGDHQCRHIRASRPGRRSAPSGRWSLQLLPGFSQHPAPQQELRFGPESPLVVRNADHLLLQSDPDRSLQSGSSPLYDYRGRILLLRPPSSFGLAKNQHWRPNTPR